MLGEPTIIKLMGFGRCSHELALCIVENPMGLSGVQGAIPAVHTFGAVKEAELAIFHESKVHSGSLVVHFKYSLRIAS